MSDTPSVKSCGGGGCCSKLGLVNLVLNAVILLILLIHFLGHGHHGWCHKQGEMQGGWGWHHPQAWGHAGPGGPPPMGPGHEAWGAWGHGPGAGPQDPKVMQDKAMEHISQFLSLTDQQKAQLRPIVNDTVAALEKNREQSHEAAKQIMDAAKAKAMPFLTADQKKLVDSLPEHKP